MRILLNIIWLIFGGLWLALGYFLAGMICCILIITIPFGIASFRDRRLRAVAVRQNDRRQAGAGAASLIGNVIWILVAGIWLAIAHIITAVAMAITIIGIPLAIANLKMVPISLMPLGKEIVSVDARPQYV